MALVGTINSGNNLNFKNKIINGNFDIWQRGTSFTTAGYSADRWYTTADTNSGWTLSQQAFTAGQTDVPNEPTYFMRFAISANNLAGPTVQQRIEDVRTFAGKTVTATFYVRASAGTAFTPTYIYMQQNFGSGGSSTVNTAPVQSLVALTSSWVKHTYTFNIPSIGSKTIGAGNYINIIFRIPDSTTTTVDFAQVQIEEGSVATGFEFRPIGVETALCQRYFQTMTFGSGSGGTYGPVSFARNSVTLCGGQVSLMVPMRATPTQSYTNNSAQIMTADGSTQGGGTIGSSIVSPYAFSYEVTYSSGGLTNGRAYGWYGGSWVVQSSAEL